MDSIKDFKYKEANWIKLEEDLKNSNIALREKLIEKKKK